LYEEIIMVTRRTLIAALSSILPLNLLAGTQATSVLATGAIGRDYFKELGIKPFINAAGSYSAYGGARMRPEVIEAMHFAIENKVKMKDLHDAIGARIAELTGAEAAMVTSGATAAMVVGTAACMTGLDKEKIVQIPDVEGLPHEVIIQKKHRYTYDRALWVPGAKLVEVETEADIRAAISDKTAMMFYLQPTRHEDDIPMQKYLALAREYNIPSFCDCATTTPPASNVVRAARFGFDLICFSGGKGLRGPYSAGLLLGKKDLIAAAREHSSPNDYAIGRGMKVAAEEYLGMLVALETGLTIDMDAESAEKRARFSRLTDYIKDVPSIKTKVVKAESEVEELYLDIDWDQEIVKLSPEGLIDELRSGTPTIEIRSFRFSHNRIMLSSTVMAEGEEIITGQRINEILRNYL
jgi:uncharacterized pyridoxal phosphate-dependent enzyme